MKILIDMNLSFHWVNVLKKSGYETIHWSTVGNLTAPDEEIMNWAKSQKVTKKRGKSPIDYLHLVIRRLDP